MYRYWLIYFSIRVSVQLRNVESRVSTDTFEITDLSQLAYDENGHLDSHWLLMNDNCPSVGPFDHRNIARMTDSLSEELVGYKGLSCNAICLERGASKDHAKYSIPEMMYDESKSDLELANWVYKECQTVEVGFISYNKNPVTIYWVASGGRLSKIHDLLPTEYHTFWSTTHLGHQFVLQDSKTFENLGNYTVLYNAFYPIGDAGTFVGTDVGDEEGGARQIFDDEFVRSKRVRRTFSEFGFAKGRLPNDLLCSIQTYYYNNQNHYVREEYENKGLTVNWYEVDPKFIGMPWGLKTYWQERLRALVEAWIGGNVPLERTDIYGMRRYEDGARLLTHVDRQETHAVSMIVNVAQSGVRSPWYVEIYDHAYRLHMVEMQPGDVVYYESAKALHGRMTPLDGGYYVNFFTHYRPVGDSKWLYKSNPPDSPQPLVDIEGIEVPTLSPLQHVVRSGTDLLNFWKMVSPPSKKSKSLDSQQTEL